MNGCKAEQPIAMAARCNERPFTSLRAVARQLRRWWQLADERRRLACLDDAALKDLGLSRADVQQETERPFWDDPLAR